MTYRRAGAVSYATADLEGRARTASPAELMVILFDAIDVTLRSAQLHLEAGRIAEKAKVLSRAVRLVNGGLRAPLDSGAKGSLSEQLAGLYAYIVRRLMGANAFNDQVQLEEATRLLHDIGAAWRTVAANGVSHAN